MMNKLNFYLNLGKWLKDSILFECFKFQMFKIPTFVPQDLCCYWIPTSVGSCLFFIAWRPLFVGSEFRIPNIVLFKISTCPTSKIPHLWSKSPTVHHWNFVKPDISTWSVQTPTISRLCGARIRWLRSALRWPLWECWGRRMQKIEHVKFEKPRPSHPLQQPIPLCKCIITVELELPLCIYLRAVWYLMIRFWLVTIDNIVIFMCLQFSICSNNDNY